MASEGMAAVPEPAQASPFARAAAFAVHVFTAAGAALCLLAMIAAVRGEWSKMFLLLGVALLVDAVDGTMARRFRVAELMQRWSGDTLDLVVDFLGYAFIPAYAIATGGLLPDLAAVPVAFLIVMTSALYFADRRMKTPDNYFRGFPALWNLVAFYYFLFRPAPWLGVGVIAALAALSFVPFPFIHPVRVARLRVLNIIVVALWIICALIAVSLDLEPGPWIKAALAVLAVCFLGAGLLRR